MVNLSPFIAVTVQKILYQDMTVHVVYKIYSDSPYAQCHFIITSKRWEQSLERRNKGRPLIHIFSFFPSGR